MYLSEVYGKGGIYAKVIAASIANNIPIYTLETKAPKFVDAEFEKHRMLSSNSSSSRAILSSKTVSAIRDDPYIPFDVRRNQKGMQGYEKFEDTDGHFAKEVYELSLYALALVNSWPEVHKQHLNRYLEPWMFQKKVVTATEWENFFNLRLAPDAQPEIQELARCMKEAIDQTEPSPLYIGQWHLPYITYSEKSVYSRAPQAKVLNNLIKCSVARCARVSYMNHDNTNPDTEKDIALYDMLFESKHLTPFEHQATPMEDLFVGDIYEYGNWPSGYTHQDKNGNMWSGNFRRWIQYRQLVSEWN